MSQYTVLRVGLDAVAAHILRGENNNEFLQDVARAAIRANVFDAGDWEEIDEAAAVVVSFAMLATAIVALAQKPRDDS